DCPIQYIITKQALQEGWDCPFAYVLSILSGSTSKTALTQLVGRILRQPYASKTQVKALDESYVYCYRQSTGNLLDYVRQGFESEGLSDLKNRIQQTMVGDNKTQEVGYRAEFKKYEGKIYLPRFVIQQENSFRPLSYEMDILKEIDWDAINLSNVENVTLSELEEENLRVGINLSDSPFKTVTTTYTESEKAVVDIDPVFMTRQLLDVIPNPWVAFEIVEKTLAIFRTKYDDEKIGANLPLIVKQLKKVIEQEKDRLAELVFRELLIEQQRIVFFVQAITDYALPSSMTVKETAKQLTHPLNKPVQMSLWEFEPEDNYNEMEKSVALWLDKQEDVLWWHHNYIGNKAYGVQGWRRNRIKPDYVATHKQSKEVYVLETKGLHLKGNDDTEYKKNFFDLLNEIGRKTNWNDLGKEFNNTITFRLIYEDDWESEINQIFKKVGSG
ncbi:MAG: restriction endonuclease subunit R, partial [Bacteroidota bacterium]